MAFDFVNPEMGAWYYDEENRWIVRDEIEDPDYGEIFCKFEQDGVPDDIDWLVEALNVRSGS